MSVSYWVKDLTLFEAIMGSWSEIRIEIQKVQHDVAEFFILVAEFLSYFAYFIFECSYFKQIFVCIGFLFELADVAAGCIASYEAEWRLS